MIENLFLPLYPYIKVAHLSMVIAWMAGMLYLPRLFINQFQSERGSDCEQMLINMQRRLLKMIINPSMIAVWALGLFMIYLNPTVFTNSWMHVKLFLVLVISGIHGFYAGSLKKFARGERPQSEKFWRVINEVPFLLMIVVLIMVMVKPF
ncbi:MAG: CopD family protein [bacterium]